MIEGVYMKYKGLDVTDKQYYYYKDRDENVGVIPSIAVDSIILSVYQNELYMLMSEAYIHGVSLIGSFMKINHTFKDSLIQIVKEKVGLDISKAKMIQSKVYDSPHRDDRGHILTACYIVFTDYVPVAGHRWFKVNLDRREQAVKLSTHFNKTLLKPKRDYMITIKDDGIETNGIDLMYSNHQGHGTMIYDAMTYLNDNLNQSGMLLNVFTDGFTYDDVYYLLKNTYQCMFSKPQIEQFINHVARFYKNEKKTNQKYELKSFISQPIL